MSPNATFRLIQHRDRGFTVAELLVVVIIVAIIATVAMPDLRSGDPAKAELAAAQVAEAIRFARSESVRTGTFHGVFVDRTTGRVLAHKVNLSTIPISTDTVLRHPVSKQPLDFNVGVPGPTAGVVIKGSGNQFEFIGGRAENDLLFTPEGVPVYIDTGAMTVAHLDKGKVSLVLGAHKSTVEVAPYTGRVTIK